MYRYRFATTSVDLMAAAPRCDALKEGRAATNDERRRHLLTECAERTYSHSSGPSTPRADSGPKQIRPDGAGTAGEGRGRGGREEEASGGKKSSRARSHSAGDCQYQRVQYLHTVLFLSLMNDDSPCRASILNSPCLFPPNLPPCLLSPCPPPPCRTSGCVTPSTRCRAA